MPKRDYMNISMADFRRTVFAGLSADALNEDLRHVVRGRCDATPVGEIVEALGGPERIDLEIIVDAAEYGHVAAVEALLRVVPAAAAQDYFDRALIGLSVYDFGSPQEYFHIARLLLDHGADPEAYETRCRQLSGSSLAKSDIHALFCDIIDAREEARTRAWQAECAARKTAPPPKP